MLGSLYSIFFLGPWILAMLEDWNPKETGVYTRIAYALLYTAWAIPMLLVNMVIGPEEGYYPVKNWLRLSAVAWVGSLIWYLIASSSARNLIADSDSDDGLPRFHQVLPFALFAISVVSIFVPMLVTGWQD